MAKKLKVAVVGASGYAGAEVVRLLASHPLVEVTSVTSSRSAGRPLREACPWLFTDLILEPFSCSLEADVFFLCQEAGFAAGVAATLAEKAKVIDLSADFRLNDPDVYQETYSLPWAGASLATPAVYAMPEVTGRTAIVEATVAANPGCFPTAALLGLMPLLRSGKATGVPVIDAKSGVSGAGRSKSDTAYTFSELADSFKPYGVVGHRHTPEIEAIAGRPVRFTPHLLPVARGLEATIYIPVEGISDCAELREIYEAAYKGEQFIHVQVEPPSIKQVVGSNSCAISVDFDPRTGHAVVMSVIDNLGKGAAGQAIQNMNLMCGLPEGTGLPVHGVWP